MRVFGALDRHRDDVVFLQDFDGPLGAAVAVRDEQDRVASLARLPDVGDPVVDTAAKLHRRLTAETWRTPLVVLDARAPRGGRRRDARLERRPM